jgi:hypothetical protein
MIYNLLGQKIKVGILDPNKINVNEFEKGLYILKIVVIRLKIH